MPWTEITTERGDRLIIRPELVIKRLRDEDSRAALTKEELMRIAKENFVDVSQYESTEEMAEAIATRIQAVLDRYKEVSDEIMARIQQR